MNAFTESERTTYYFQVSTPAFNKSLHIFSRMFAEPLFDMNYMNKEIDAVNSEAEKNLNADGWRKRQLLKSFANQNHPYSKFSTGNTETLRGISADLLNKKLKNFYDKYYKSQNMKLAVISNSTLDALQNQITNIFSDIRNATSKEKFDLYGNLETEELPFYKNQNLGKIAYYKRISTGNVLDLFFSLNSTKISNEKKPFDYLDYMMKYSGEKSLINFLKKRNLANKLDASIYESFKTFSIYCISLELTDEGLTEVEGVIKLVFNYLNKIKQSKKEEKVFSEIQKIYDSAFRFQEKNEDYTSFVSGLSTSMFDINSNTQYRNLLYMDYQHSEFDPNLIEASISKITPENSVILVGSHANISESLRNQFFKSSSNEYKQEKWYGTQYLVNSLDEFFLHNLNQFPVELNSRTEKKTINVDPQSSFELRKENNFITKLNSLIYSCEEKNLKCDSYEFTDKSGDLEPTALYDDANLRVFYKIDRTFHVPKIYVYIHVFSDMLKKNIVSYANFNFVSEYLEYELNTNLSQAVEAGNLVGLEFDDTGITITIQAYSDVVEKVIEIVFNNLFKLQPSEYTFAEIFENAMKNFEDNKIRKPIIKNKLFFNKLLKYNYTLYTEVLDYYYSNEKNQMLLEDKRFENIMGQFYTLGNNENVSKNNSNITSNIHENHDSNQNKILKFSKKQIFEDFKKFYEELKKGLVFNILFYGYMDSNEEITKISKNIKEILSGHSNLNNRISNSNSKSHSNEKKSSSHLETNNKKTSNRVNKENNKKEHKENHPITQKKEHKENLQTVQKKEHKENHVSKSNREAVFRKSQSKRMIDHTDSIRNSIHLHRRIDDQIIFQFVNDAENEINHGITTYYQIGARDVQKTLSFSLIDKCLGTIFYHNLRTIQQVRIFYFIILLILKDFNFNRYIMLIYLYLIYRN